MEKEKVKFCFSNYSLNKCKRFGKYEKLIQNDINEIEKTLGKKVRILDDFFRKYDIYHDEDLIELGINLNEFEDYTSLKHGKKILQLIKNKG